MRRWLGILLTAGSLAVCAIACALWGWTAADPGHAKTAWFERAGGELSGVRAAGGQLAWVGLPPPVGPPAERAAVADRVDELDTFKRYAGGGGPQPNGPDAEGGRPTSRVEWLEAGYPCAADYFMELTDRPRPAAVRPLFDALSDPKRFLGAHVLLMYRAGSRALARATPRDGRFVASFDGLEVDFGSQAEWQRGKRPASTVDPAQIPALRRQWADRLGIPAASVPLWVVAAAAAVLPAARAAAAARGLARRRAGRCRACGYDLRASPGRCPECGAGPVAGAV